jgi:aryl-alcohol dehydrogenase-like predicted oxidoreductase/ketosteroid isomerase-like protein
MDYASLGNSGLKVSPACLGAMNFGTSGGVASCAEDEARRIVDAFLDAGHNVIDTADGYTGGQSEEIVGRAVQGRRDAVVLATKAFSPQGAGPNERGLARVHLTRALEASLRRLGTDYIDLYQCHQWDATTPVEETLATLDGFVRAGKVRYLGCSNFTAAQLVESQLTARQLGATPFVSLQPQYSLVARGIEAEILPACARYGLGTLVWSPLAGGVLAGRYRRGAAPGPDTRVARLTASPSPMARAWADGMLTGANLDIAGEVARVAADLDTTPAVVALAWVRQRPGVTSVIIGPRTVDQLRDNLAGLAFDLPAGAVRRLDEASAGTVGRPVDGMTHARPAETRTLVARYFDMWNSGDASIAAEILSPDWVDHAHPEVTGPDGVRRAVERIRAASPDLRFEIDAILGDGPLVAASGGTSSTRMIWLVRAEDGRLSEMWTYVS